MTILEEMQKLAERGYTTNLATSPNMTWSCIVQHETKRPYMMGRAESLNAIEAFDLAKEQLTSKT